MSNSAVITCPGCQRQYRINPQIAGKKVRCKCGTSIQIPAEPAAAEQEWNPLDDLLDNAGPAAAKPPEATPPATSPATSPAKPGRTCPSCGTSVGAAAVICISCGTNLKTGKAVGAGIGGASAKKGASGALDHDDFDEANEVDAAPSPRSRSASRSDAVEPVAGMTASTLKLVSIGITIVFIGVMLQLASSALSFIPSWVPLSDLHRNIITLVGAVCGLIGPLFCLATPKATGARGFIIGSVGCQLGGLAALGIGFLMIFNSATMAADAVKPRPRTNPAQVTVAPPVNQEIEPEGDPEEDIEEDEDAFFVDRPASERAMKMAGQAALLMLGGVLLSLVSTLLFVYFLKGFANYMGAWSVVGLADDTLKAAFITAGCFAALFVPILGCFAIFAVIGAGIYFAVQYTQLLYAMTRIVQAYAKEVATEEAGE